MLQIPYLKEAVNGTAFAPKSRPPFLENVALYKYIWLTLENLGGLYHVFMLHSDYNKINTCGSLS